jgi:hypothetical protein
MPALILFGASGSTETGKADRSAQLRVRENAEDVIAKLGASGSGFADLTPANKPREKVWVNRDQIRMVRST